MDPKELDGLLRAVRDGRVTPEAAADRLRTLPYEDLGFARPDHHRALRRGFPEVVFGAGKTDQQVLAIVKSLADRGQNVLVTRTGAETHHLVADRFPAARFHESARCITLIAGP